MKYVDAEKLKVLLSDLKENHKYYNGDFHDGVVFAAGVAKELIDSLQQEQPHWKPTEEQMEALARATNRCVGVKDAQILLTMLNDINKL